MERIEESEGILMKVNHLRADLSTILRFASLGRKVLIYTAPFPDTDQRSYLIRWNRNHPPKETSSGEKTSI